MFPAPIRVTLRLRATPLSGSEPAACFQPALRLRAGGVFPASSAVSAGRGGPLSGSEPPACFQLRSASRSGSRPPRSPAPSRRRVSSFDPRHAPAPGHPALRLRAAGVFPASSAVSAGRGGQGRPGFPPPPCAWATAARLRLPPHAQGGVRPGSPGTWATHSSSLKLPPCPRAGAARVPTATVRVGDGQARARAAPGNRDRGRGRGAPQLRDSAIIPPWLPSPAVGFCARVLPEIPASVDSLLSGGVPDGIRSTG